MNDMLPQSQIVTEELVLAKCRYFVDVGLWPRRSRLDPIGWLENFSTEERGYALHLLNGFMYFSEDLIQQIFLGSFTGLARFIATPDKSPGEAALAWRQFITEVLIVRVTGEMPNDTDSGYLFTRMARDCIGITEDRIVQHPSALSLAKVNPFLPIVFVDDFVGSGLQFVTMWNRKYSLPGGGRASFSDIAAPSKPATLFYCPLFCTAKGAKFIRDSCPDLILSPAHELSARYSALDPASVIWPESLRAEATSFIANVSQRAGIPNKNGRVGDWRGFHKLGLTLSFQHGTPDATLPIFYWSQASWKPLVKK